MVENIEGLVSQAYVDFRNFHRSGDYSLTNSQFRNDEGYAEIAPTPSTWSNGKSRLANYESRTKIFNKMVSDYLGSGFDVLSARQDSHVESYVSNNAFRSRITFRSDNLELYVWVPKFSWLFGNRVRMKYKIKRPNAGGEELNIFRRFFDYFTGRSH